ncbi:MAG: type VI secretion system contractile sheath large subunit, partial [Planctomycetaceae bacterium]|nr:type VI secretion system contractile sheath large subunit [Planctomycetaceae bacterium]
MSGLRASLGALPEASVNYAGSEPAPVVPTLLDRMLETAGDVDTSSAYVVPLFVEEFLAAESDWQCVRQLFDRADLSSMTLIEYRRQLSHLICRIEQLLQSQLHELLHHEDFQRLEASWRGLRYLVEQAERSQKSDRGLVKVQVLNLSLAELQEDITKSIEFDQSQLFQKVYQQRFGLAGGEPFGLLLGDYAFGVHRRDCELLGELARISSASFAPFVAAAQPQLLGLESFAQLGREFDLASTFLQPEFTPWRSFRGQRDAKFVSLIAPRVVYRKPYRDTGESQFGFRFEEDVAGQMSPDDSTIEVGKYLWGNPCYAFGAVVIRSYCRTGWFADIRGQRVGEIGGGMVEGLPQIDFDTEAPGMALRPQTEVVLSRYWEDELIRNGIIPMVDCQDAPYSMFPGNPSTYLSSREYSDAAATENERLSAMTQYVLCASRFAHYLKVIVRDKIGSMENPQQLESELNGRWLQRYVSSAPQLDTKRRAEFPLKEGRVVIERV